MYKDAKQEKLILEKLNLLNNDKVPSDRSAGLSSREIDLLQTNVDGAIQSSKNGTWAGLNQDKSNQSTPSLQPCTTHPHHGTKHLHGLGGHGTLTTEKDLPF